MDFNAKLENNDQVNQIAEYLRLNVVTAPCWTQAAKCRNFTIRIDNSIFFHTAAWEHGACVKDENPGATIWLKPGELVGGAMMYCLQEVINIANIGEINQWNESAKKRAFNEAVYVDSIERVEYRAYEVRREFGTWLNANEPQEWSWQRFNGGEAKMTFQEYMTILSPSHTQAIAKRFKTLQGQWW
jgi:hypothetical protein